MKIINNYIRIIFALLFTANCFAQEDTKSSLKIPANIFSKTNFFPGGSSLIKDNNELRIEGFIGFPYNLPLPFTISQSDNPDIKITAHFASKPFEIPIYWVWRIIYQDRNNSWELEAIHHKLFLKNKPHEVEEFSISHGLNLITINRGWQFNDFILRAGAGITITHPESIVRNKKFNENEGIFNWGYYISGPALNIAAARNLLLFNNFYAICEVKTSLSFGSVPVYEGNAELYNIAFHLNFGIGFSLLKF